MIQQRKTRPIRNIAVAAVMFGLLMLCTGCDGDRFDATKLRKGMDRSAIIAQYGTPDSRKQHDTAERLIYKDGEHYQYLLLLIDGKLRDWEQDRVYQTSRFSHIREHVNADKSGR